jgi:ApbE superfamily uncharacterized protein (UPF0280 family)
MRYQERFYRNIVTTNLNSFSVRIKESDLFILADTNLSEPAKKQLNKQRYILEQYINQHPDFYLSFTPVFCEKKAPEIVKLMSEASFLCNVGPMATVAGALAEQVGKYLLNFSSQIIIENGGDLFLMIKKEIIVAIFAGDGPFSLKIGLRIKPRAMPFGIATSSGTVGYSTSQGQADSVTVICPTATLADGLATYMCNLTCNRSLSSLETAIKQFPFLEGIIAIKNKELFVWGDIEIVQV